MTTVHVHQMNYRSAPVWTSRVNLYLTELETVEPEEVFSRALLVAVDGAKGSLLLNGSTGPFLL